VLIKHHPQDRTRSADGDTASHAEHRTLRAADRGTAMRRRTDATRAMRLRVDIELRYLDRLYRVCLGIIEQPFPQNLLFKGSEELVGVPELAATTSGGCGSVATGFDRCHLRSSQ